MKLPLLLLYLLGISQLAQAQISEIEQAVSQGFASLCREVCKVDAATCQRELKSGELTIYSQITMDAIREKGINKINGSVLTRIDVLNIQFDEVALRCTGSVKYTTDKPLTGNVRASALVAFAPDTVRADLHRCLAGLESLTQSHTLPAGEASVLMQDRNGKPGIYLFNRAGVYFGEFPEQMLSAVFNGKKKLTALQASRGELEKQVILAKDDDRRTVLERAMSKLDIAIRSQTLVVAREQSQHFTLSAVAPKQAPVILTYEINAGVPEITILATGTANMTMQLIDVGAKSEITLMASEILERLQRFQPGPVKPIIIQLRHCTGIDNKEVSSKARVELEARTEQGR